LNIATRSRARRLPALKENLMKKTLTAFVAAATMASAIAAMPTAADARCDGCAIGAGVVGGLVAALPGICDAASTRRLLRATEPASTFLRDRTGGLRQSEPARTSPELEIMAGSREPAILISRPDLAAARAPG